MDKPKETIICSRNSQIGIQFKKSDGLLSNQIFNTKTQSPLLTSPLSARNSIYLDQSEIKQFNEQSNQESDEKNNYQGIHQVPQNITHKNFNKTQTQNKPKYFTQNYSQQNYNPYTDPRQIKKQFQINDQKNSKIIKQKNIDNINDQNQKFHQSQITNQNSGFKLFSKMQKIQTNNNNKSKEGHIVITLPKSKRKFDSFPSTKQRQQSNSLDQTNINDHFQRLLQNQEPRELYTQPFFYSQYSQISKITVSSSSEKFKQNLYKPIKKQRTNLSHQNKSYDQPQQQYYSDDSFEGNSQNVKKVDLYKLSQERVESLQNSNEKSNFNITSNVRNLNSSGYIKNQLYESPTQNYYNYQQTLESRQIDERAHNFQEQFKNSNLQANFNQFNQVSQTESYIQQNSITSKKPIQIKLNLKQFIQSEQQINHPTNSPRAFTLLEQYKNKTAANQ
ncbi:unnamed protein product [Paramecium sonneborni]|uniref:Uncharacterized protein n=1 Tax=Paramecium sonneborni TaxID=65129 RepID=A0A8S1QA06_9CILI|nr:unnamed protein product [Paramecium sonneborni]